MHGSQGVSTPSRYTGTCDAYEETELVERVRAGDAQALDRIFRSTAAGLCGFAFTYVKSRAIAEELVQDVFLKIWQGRGEWHLRLSLRTYLYAATRHAALNHLRHQRVEHRWYEHVVHQRALPRRELRRAGPVDELLSDELAVAAAQAVQQLPPRCRLIYCLTRQQQLSYAEVAAILCISVRTVENQIGIALKVLRKRLAHLLPDADRIA